MGRVVGLALAVVAMEVAGVPAAGQRTAAEPPATATPRRRPPPPPEPEPEAAPSPPVPVTDEPTGFPGLGRPPRELPPDELVPLPDRWRIGWPSYERYPGTGHEAPQAPGRWWNPYRQNVLKGDYPVLGQHTFLACTLRSDTLLEGRRLPTPSDVSSARPDSADFFGKGASFLLEQNFLVSVELFHGNAGFKPRDWEVRATPVFNLNYLATRENGVVNIDPRRGTDRFDDQIAFQELFGDVKLADVGPSYDTVNLRAGIQGFQSDFRGLLFNDFAPGARLSGSAAANRTQWNLAYFRPLDKDTNSGLNTLFRDRDEDVVIANLTRQDFLWPGYQAQLSVHYDFDHASRHYDENGFLVRPANIGDAAPHGVRVGYLGWTGDGHIDRIGVSHAVFGAIGSDGRNPIAGRQTDINAQLVALELSYDRDWLRFKGSFLWASGDPDPEDGVARGFDAILDNPLFAGGPFSFWQRQAVKLTGTNVNLVNRASLLPTLRSSKGEGQASFVNPGLFLTNVGLSGRLTPRLSFETNLSWLRFQDTAPLQLVLLQEDVPHDVGLDYGIGLVYRPLLIDNVIAVLGAAGFTPLAGFREIYPSETLFQAFSTLTLTY
jgi:hypothetical protein